MTLAYAGIRLLNKDFWHTIDVRDEFTCASIQSGSWKPPVGLGRHWEEFMGVGEKDFLISLLRHSQDRFLNKTVQSNQIVPWKDTFKVFKKVIAEILKTSPAASQSLITFEYELPFEDGNRPDVVLVLSNGHIVVVECKDKLKPSARDYNQVIYYRDRISRYHSKSHGLQNS